MRDPAGEKRSQDALNLLDGRVTQDGFCALRPYLPNTSRPEIHAKRCAETHLLFKHAGRENVARLSRTIPLSSGIQEFDLTVLRDPSIIACTSLLWRADKPVELELVRRGLHGWRQNISL